MGFINATDCADYMVKKGLPFRDAYRIVGEIVYECTERGLTLETYPLEDYQKKSPVFAEDVYKAIDLATCVQERRSQGGPARASVEAQLQSQKERMEEIL